jgi:uncharacterized protein involved in exopolysaccharide biosynthesis
MADTMNANSLSTGLPSKRDIVNIVFKRKKQIIYTFLCTVFLVILGSYVIPLQFYAFSTVYVKRNLPPIPNLSDVHMVLDRVEVINSEIEVIKSRAVAEKVVEMLLAMGKDPQRGAETDSILARIKATLKPIKNAVNEFLVAIGLIGRASEREVMISAMRDNLIIKPIVNSNIVTIGYNSPNPEFAATVVNSVTKVYLEETHGLEKRQGLLELYNAQLEESQSAIKKLESEVQSLKQSASIVSVDEQIKLKFQELTALNTNLNQLRGEKMEITRKIATLKEQVREQPGEVVNAKTTRPNPKIDQLGTKLLELESERARHLEKFVPGSRKIKEYDDAIRLLREGIKNEPLTVVDSQSIGTNPIRQNLTSSLFQAEADLSAKAAREAVMVRQIEEARVELRRLDQHAMKFKEISGAISNAEKSYARYVDQREDARVAALSDPKMTNVRVVHYAAVPEIPVLSRMFLIQIGAFVGLLMGFGLVFVLEFFDHSLGNKEDVEYYLDLPLIASIPEINDAGRGTNAAHLEPRSPS